MANTYLERTVTTPDTNGNKKATFSAWLKRSKLNTDQVFYTSRSSDSNYFRFRFTSDQINVISKTSGTNYYATTSAVFRDISGWYHVVVAFDTTQATEANRIRIYVNGVEQTKGASNYPSQDATLYMLASGQPQRIGKESSDGFYDGSISHAHYTEGYAYDASAFGSTDSTTGQWKINTSPSVTYGSNGFFILKDGNSVTDQSGQSNNFTVGGGTLTKTEDCPSNVFATLNALSYQVASQYASVPTNGNTASTSGSGNAWGTLLSTIGASSGKYYCEGKVVALGSYARPGICDMSVNQQNSSTQWYLGETSSSAQYSYNSGNGNLYTNAGDSSYGNSFTTGDIIGIAMDLDNSKLYFSKNGTWQNSGVPTSGSTGTGAVSITAGKTYGFGFSSYASTVWYINFGNGYFSTGAVASAGTNASGNGIFEYDTPTGYTALSTSGLNK